MLNFTLLRARLRAVLRSVVEDRTTHHTMTSSWTTQIRD